MSREEWEAEQAAQEAVDPGEPVPVASDGGEVGEDTPEEGPEPHIIVDEQTGQHYLAFEIEPPEEEEEEGEKK
jgi:hypothetical protein